MAETKVGWDAGLCALVITKIAHWAFNRVAQRAPDYTLACNLISMRQKGMDMPDCHMIKPILYVNQPSV